MFAAAWAVCFEGSVAGVNATETGNEVSQPKLEFTPLDKNNGKKLFTSARSTRTLLSYDGFEKSSLTGNLINKRLLFPSISSYGFVSSFGAHLVHEIARWYNYNKYISAYLGIS